MARGTSLRGTIGLILVRKGFNYFIFYIIDRMINIDYDVSGRKSFIMFCKLRYDGE